MHNLIYKYEAQGNSIYLVSINMIQTLVPVINYYMRYLTWDLKRPYQLYRKRTIKVVFHLSCGSLLSSNLKYV